MHECERHGEINRKCKDRESKDKESKTNDTMGASQEETQGVSTANSSNNVYIYIYVCMYVCMYPYTNPIMMAQVSLPSESSSTEQ
jgi:hypothetical protein